MSSSTIASLLVVVIVLVSVCPWLGRYMAAVFGDGPAPGDRWLHPGERRLYQLMGTSEDRPRWTAYVASVLALSVVTMLGLYAALRFQGGLPFNPNGVSDMSPSLAFNTAASFVTGTNWQAYAGESAASHLAAPDGLGAVTASPRFRVGTGEHSQLPRANATLPDRSLHTGSSACCPSRLMGR